MSASLRALLTGLIDYAGLFPPASLSLSDALQGYCNHRTGPYCWMLGRFLCPAARFRELDPFLPALAAGPPLAFTALGRAGNSTEEFLAGLELDLLAIADLRTRFGSAVSIDVLETRLPTEGIHEGFLQAVADQVRGTTLSLFLEYPARERQELSDVLTCIRATSFDRPVGYKLRTGGLEAAAFPTSERVAMALTFCLDRGLLFKATAGLHHPLPRFDPKVQARMHGFVNLFLAGVFVHSRHACEELARELLEEENPAQFAFSDEFVCWRNHRVSVAEILRTRQQGVVSFGSCSFDEPCADLQELGWLQKGDTHA